MIPTINCNLFVSQRSYVMSNIGRRIAATSAWLVLLAAGCTKQITITQYPAFWTDDLKTVAVVPFRNTTNVQGAGETIAEQLARGMAANRTYKVYNRYDLKTQMDEADLQMALGGDTAQAAKAMEKIGNVQAIITGTVTTYSATTRSENRSEPQYNNRGNIVGYSNWVFTHNEGTVVVTAAILRSSDGSGTTLHATGTPVQETVTAESSQFSAPNMDPHGCLAAATRKAVERLQAEFCVTRQTIKIKPKDTLFTASEYYEGSYKKTSSFSGKDDHFLAVLSLPASCDRNRFRLAITRENDRKVLWEETVTWQREWVGDQGKSFELSPAKITADGGPGKFELKLYSGEKPVLIQPFTIK